ncbi:MAG: hypothetical protein Tsb004_28070 [Allomuricauda sp.]
MGRLLNMGMQNACIRYGCLILVWVSSLHSQNTVSTKDYEDLREMLAPLQVPLSEPGPEDWLSLYREHGQTFEEYKATYNPMRYGTGTIYLKKMGQFNSQENLVFEKVKEYLNVFFQQEVEVLTPHLLDHVPDRFKRQRFGHEQVMTPFIFSEMSFADQDDRLAYLALTNVDMYPNQSMNFVFGEADYQSRIGITSMYRLLSIENDSVDVSESAVQIAKTASHEIGHMLGFNHCIAFGCLMNGANNEEEAKRQPMNFCEECTLKLFWALELDFTKRVKDLERLWETWGFPGNARYYQKCYRQ